MTHPTRQLDEYTPERESIFPPDQLTAAWLEDWGFADEAEATAAFLADEAGLDSLWEQYYMEVGEAATRRSVAWT